MLSINTNLSSIIAQRSMKQSTNKLNQAIERMTTGAKINHAKDNAANYNIATNMTTKLGALQVAEDNCAMGLDMIATANGTLDQIHDKLQRLRDLAVQSSNGTYGSQSKQAINAEANALVDEIERLYNTSEYNGINLMKGQVTGSEESNFIKDIDRRDTSKMTTLASVDVSTKLNSGTYSISTPEELAKLATMTNNGLIGENCEFVLGADIDLSGYANWEPIGNSTANMFSSKFDGNGYIISNLKISSSTISTGLFGYTRIVEICNLGLENVDITNSNDYISVGSLIGNAPGFTYINNCYATGKLQAKFKAAGLVGDLYNSSIIENCWTDVDIDVGRRFSGGITAYMSNWSTIKNCFALGDINCTGEIAGGLVGFIGSNSSVEKSYASGSVIGSGIQLAPFIAKNDSTGKIIDCDNIEPILLNKKINYCSNSVSLQIGTVNNINSSLCFELDLKLQNIKVGSNLALRNPKTVLTNLDNLLLKISDKQIELGVTENRLNSALEEISTQYENLVSSRSTLQDADIAEVSSEYIRQQILQQASATLLATANQSPSIALQLI